MMMRPETNLKSWRMGDEALFFVMVSFVLTISLQVPLCTCVRERERELKEPFSTSMFEGACGLKS